MKTSNWIKVRTSIFGNGVVSRECALALVSKKHPLGKLPRDIAEHGLTFVNRVTGTTVRVARANGRLYRVSSLFNQFQTKFYGGAAAAASLESRNITNNYAI